MSEQDHIDQLVAKWDKERPDYDLAPVQIIGRLGRIAEYVDRALEAKFEEFGISRASFDVLATLRRSGPPYALTQRELMRNLLRTSGSISVRIDAMEAARLVVREAAAEDRRATLVTITEKGTALLENIVPHHLLNEERLLSAFTAQDRRELIGLLRKWVLSFESSEDNEPYIHYGLILLNPRVSLQRRRAAGLPDVAGILVHAVESNSIADNAGLRKGDLVVAVGTIPIDSLAKLRRALNQRTPRAKSLQILRGAVRLEVKVSATGD